MSRALATACLLLVPTTLFAGELRVHPDKENVVASRLEGTWRPHPALTQRLTGKPPKSKAEEPTGAIRFESDPSVAAVVPE